jgi:hypothetical protein
MEAKIILLLSLIFLSSSALADCIEDPTMRKVIIDEDGERIAFLRCENKEAICYKWGLSISCFKK